MDFKRSINMFLSISMLLYKNDPMHLHEHGGVEGGGGFVIDNDELLRTIWEHKRILPGGPRPRALHLCY